MSASRPFPRESGPSKHRTFLRRFPIPVLLSRNAIPALNACPGICAAGFLQYLQETIAVLTRRNRQKSTRSLKNSRWRGNMRPSGQARIATARGAEITRPGTSWRDTSAFPSCSRRPCRTHRSSGRSRSPATCPANAGRSAPTAAPRHRSSFRTTPAQSR